MRCEDCNVEMIEKRVDGKGAAIGAAVGAFLLGPVGLLGGAALGARVNTGYARIAERK